MTTKHCKHCQAVIPPRGRGRPPTFCSAYCRVTAWVKQQREARMVEQQRDPMKVAS